MPEDELKVYIEKLLKMGYETHIIKEHLVKAGHHHKKVDHNIHNLIETIHTDLIEFVENELKKGHKLKDITDELTRKGHPTHKINHIHKYYETKHKKHLIFEEICTKYSENSLGKIILWILLIILGISMLGFIAGHLYLDSLQVKEIFGIMANYMSLDESSLVNTLLFIVPIIISVSVIIVIIVSVICLLLSYTAIKQFNAIKQTHKEINTTIISYLTVPLLFIAVSLVVNIITLLVLKEVSMIITFVVPIIGFGIYFYNINHSINQHKLLTITTINILLFAVVAIVIGIIAIYIPPKAYELMIAVMGFSS